MGDELYTCNGCSEQIQKDRARIACHTCPDYYLCANCFVIKQYIRPHVNAHSTMVLKLSGIVVPPPPGFPPRPAPALPPRHNSTANTRQTVRVSEIPTANWGALWNVIKAPLDKLDKKNRKESVDSKSSDFKDVELRGRSDSDMTSGLGHDNSSNSSPLTQNPTTGLPPSPPKSVRQGLERVDSDAPSYPRPATWQPLFEVDGTPAPIFVALLSTIFSHLDPEHTGYFAPEVYSAFLDVQGCELDKNPWKRTLGNEDTDSAKDMADLELGLYFSENNVSHILNVRSKTPTTEASEEEPPTSAVEKRIRLSFSFKPNMPMLSRQGFIDLTAIEYLKDLDQAHEYLARATQAFDIWNELGPMPRSVLPNAVTKIEKKEESTAGIEDEAEKHSVGDKGKGKEEEEGVKAGEKEEKMPSPTLPMNLKGGETKIEALITGEKLEEEKTPSPTLPIKLKGGEAKIEALVSGETFEDAESSKSTTERKILTRQPTEDWEKFSDTEIGEDEDDKVQVLKEDEVKVTGEKKASEMEAEVVSEKPDKVDSGPHEIYKAD